MYIVKYEELRYVVAEHTADESLRLVLVDTSFVFAFLSIDVLRYGLLSEILPAYQHICAVVQKALLRMVPAAVEGKGRAGELLAVFSCCCQQKKR